MALLRVCYPCCRPQHRTTMIEQLAVNLTVGKARRATLKGRDYLVAPMTLIVPGVLNGSKGALYYPPDEIAASVDAWDGMPIVVTHPRDEQGNPVKARQPSVIEKLGIGFVYHAQYDDKLHAEGWFDVEDCGRVEPRVLSWLSQGTPFELSTGLYTKDEPVPPGTAFNGTPYDYVARNYKPDHLAVLPDEVGACSMNDGCGVLVNEADHSAVLPTDSQDANPPLDPNITLLRRIWRLVKNALPGQPRSKATGGYKRMGAGVGKGEAHRAAQAGAMVLTEQERKIGSEAALEGSMPTCIQDPAKWERAKAKATEGNYQGNDYWPAVVHIYVGLGGSVHYPTDNARPTDQPTPLTTEEVVDMNKDQLISWLTTNCDCWKQPGDKELLSKMSLDKLKLLKTNVEKFIQNSAVINAAKAGFASLVKNKKATDNADGEETAGVDIMALAELLGVTDDPAQDPAAFIKSVMAALDVVRGKLSPEATPAPPPEAMQEPLEEEEEEPIVMSDPNPQPTGNRTKKQTSRLTPAEQETLNWAKQEQLKQKASLVAQLTANVDPKAKAGAVAIYNKMALNELQALAAGLPRQQQPQYQPSYAGAAGGPVGNAYADDVDESDVLEPPSTDWEELAAESRRKRA